MLVYKKNPLVVQAPVSPMNYTRSREQSKIFYPKNPLLLPSHSHRTVHDINYVGKHGYLFAKVLHYVIVIKWWGVDYVFWCDVAVLLNIVNDCANELNLLGVKLGILA